MEIVICVINFEFTPDDSVLRIKIATGDPIPNAGHWSFDHLLFLNINYHVSSFLERKFKRGSLWCLYITMHGIY